jgi:hypothetical protein
MVDRSPNILQLGVSRVDMRSSNCIVKLREILVLADALEPLRGVG